jgi:hypothetical protein
VAGTRYTIGSVNGGVAVALQVVITFMLLEESKGWQVIIGLILGGVIAAPMAL